MVLLLKVFTPQHRQPSEMVFTGIYYLMIQYIIPLCVTGWPLDCMWWNFINKWASEENIENGTSSTGNQDIALEQTCHNFVKKLTLVSLTFLFAGFLYNYITLPIIIVQVLS